MCVFPLLTPNYVLHLGVPTDSVGHLGHRKIGLTGKTDANHKLTTLVLVAND